MKPFKINTVVLLLLSMSIFFINSTIAQKSLSNSSSFSHLFDVNHQWEKYKSQSPKGSISFLTETDRISFHLINVIKNLKQNTSNNFSLTEKKNRFELLEKLQEYAIIKKFPTNTFHSARTPYFVDIKGVHCAVAYMMAESGNNQLVEEISREHNYDYIKDITTEGVLAWADEFGFTIDELKWIQPTYGLNYSYKTLLKGSNGEINKTTNRNYSSQKVIFSGKFDSLNLLPCSNIGYYNGENLLCYGNGINGTINSIGFGDKLYAVGLLEFQNTIYSFADFSNDVWNYYNIPNREGWEATAVDLGSHWLVGMNIAIKNPNNTSQTEVWNLKNEHWRKIATVNGMVLVLKNYTGLGQVIAGHFDTILVHNQTEIYPPDTVSVKNIALKVFQSPNWYGLGNEVSDTIFDVEGQYNSLFIAGTCQYGSDYCLTRYMNNDLQPLILRSHFSDSANVIIKDIYFKNSKLLIGGKFNIQPMMGEFGSNLGEYDLLGNYVHPLSTLNQTVNCINYYNNEQIIGGNFTSDNFSELSFIAKYDGVKSHNPYPIDTKIEIVKTNKLNLIISPNPFTTEITLNGEQNIYDFIIFNSSGKKILSGKTLKNKIYNLGVLKEGIYILKLTFENKEYVQKVVKN